MIKKHRAALILLGLFLMLMCLSTYALGMEFRHSPAVMRSIIRDHGSGVTHSPHADRGIKNQTIDPAGRTQKETDITIGTNGLLEFKGDLKGPIVSDRFFISVSGRVSEQEGIMDNTLNTNRGSVRHIHSESGSIRLKFLASDCLDISMNLDGDRREKLMFPFRRTPRNSFVKKGLFPADERYRYSQDFEGTWGTDYMNLTLNIKTLFPLCTFTAITGYREVHVDKLLDSDFSPLDMSRKNIFQNDNTLTQKFHLRSKTSESPFRWLTGLNFFKKGTENYTTTFYRPGMSGNAKNPFGSNTGSRLDFSDQANKGAALFGRAAATIQEKLDVTLGLHYQFNDVHMHQVQTDLPDNHCLSSKAFPDAYRTFSELIPLAGFAWHLEDNHTVYASFTGGYKSGGFNKMALTGYTSFKEETSCLYEVGTKFILPDQKLSVNLCGFYMDIRNEQVLRYDSTQAFPCIVNAESSHRLGLELELQYSPWPCLDFVGGLGILEAEYDKYIDPSSGTDYQGKKIRSVPDYGIKVGVQYCCPLHAQWKFLGNVGFSGFGSRYFDDANTVKEKPHGLINAKIGIIGERFDLCLWSKNVLNHHYITFENTAKGVAKDGAPITVGMNIKYRF